ncbi:MAG: O-antigen ligase family protein [Oscillospiraceae bacterium]|nr:O-antigen ligase family protein [Oscillospiraceae bacterium]
MDNETEKRRIVLQIVYIFIFAAAAMGDMPAFTMGIARMMKGISLLIVVIGATMLFVSGDLRRVRTGANFVFVYAFILVGIIVWSIFLWIINLETVDFIIRGATKFMYQFMVLMIIFAGTYIFGERAIYTTFYGLALANTIMLVMNVGIYGPVESFNSILAMFQGTDAQTGFSRAMEIHDITFTYGFFIIYFLFFAQHTKERVFDIIVSVFYFILGWKRIALAALPVTIFFALVMGRMQTKTRVRLMHFLAWVLVAAAFTYVVITRVGLFEALTQRYDIDTMGRNEVYRYIEKYYRISLGFLGYGFEYTTVILQRISAANPEAHIGVLALHNDILTIYIELGFVGFWAWMLYTWIFQLRWMLNHWGEKVAMLFFFCELYVFITYMTDNTLYYFYTSLVLRLMPMAYAFHETTEQDIRLWPWVRAQKGFKTG